MGAIRHLLPHPQIPLRWPHPHAATTIHRSTPPDFLCSSTTSANRQLATEMFSPMGMSSFFLCESRHLIKTGKEKNHIWHNGNLRRE
jgi:hypothetical protein